MTRSLLLAALVLWALPASAQSLPGWAAPSDAAPVAAPPTSQTMPPTTPSTPAQVPLDGGLGLLALAGAGYAAHKLRQRADA